MNIQSIFTEPSKPVHSVFRYTMLGIVLLWFARDIHIFLQARSLGELPPGWPSGDFYRSVVLDLTMLFGLLAYQFKWPKGVLVALRVLAWSWTVFGFVYILAYW